GGTAVAPGAADCARRRGGLLRAALGGDPARLAIAGAAWRRPGLRPRCGGTPAPAWRADGTTASGAAATQAWPVMLEARARGRAAAADATGRRADCAHDRATACGHARTGRRRARSVPHVPATGPDIVRRADRACRVHARRMRGAPWLARRSALRATGGAVPVPARPGQQPARLCARPVARRLARWAGGVRRLHPAFGAGHVRVRAAAALALGRALAAP